MRLLTCLKHGLFIGKTLILDEFMYIRDPLVFLFITTFAMNRLHSMDSVDRIESSWVSRWNPSLTEVNNFFFLITSKGQNFILGFFSFLFSSLNNISTVLSFCFFDLCIYSIFFFLLCSMSISILNLTVTFSK